MPRPIPTVIVPYISLALALSMLACSAGSIGETNSGQRPPIKHDDGDAGDTLPAGDSDGDNTGGDSMSGDGASSGDSYQALGDSQSGGDSGPTPRFSLEATTLTLSSATVASGDSSALEIATFDTDGNPYALEAALISLSLDGGTCSGEFATVVSGGNGIYVTTFVGTLAGTASTISTTIDGSQASNATAVVTVIPGSASTASSELTLDSSLIASGSTTTARLVLRDTAGNRLATGGHNVSFAIGGGESQGTFDTVLDDGGGNYTSQLLATVAGSESTVTAQIDALDVTQSANIVVVPGPLSAAQSSLDLSAAMVTAGEQVQATLTARDAAANVLVGGGLTVLFSHGGGGSSTGSFAQTNDPRDGTYSSAFTGETAGAATTVSASVANVAASEDSPQVIVQPGPYSLSRSVLECTATLLGAGEQALVTLTLLDGYGNATPASGLDVQLSLSGGTSTANFSTVVDHGDGTYSAQLTAFEVGTASTFGATVGGQVVTSNMPTLEVHAGAISLDKSQLSAGVITLVSGSSTTVTLTLRDAYDNPILVGGYQVAFSHSGGTSSGSFGAVLDQGDGIYSVSFTAIVAGTEIQIAGTVDSGALTTTLPITVVPGAVSLAHSTIGIARSTLKVGMSLPVTLVLRDANGNAVDAPGSTVTFSHSGGTSTGSFESTADVGDGSYVATFSAAGIGSATVLSALVDTIEVVGSSVTVVAVGSDLSTSIDMLSVPVRAPATGGWWTTTVTAINTDHYDGTVSYRLDFLATNYGSETPSVRLYDKSGNLLVNASVGAFDSNRYVRSFTPTSGAGTYWLGSTSQSAEKLVVRAARIVITQVGATKTAIYYPLVHGAYYPYVSRSAVAETTTTDTFTRATGDFLGGYHKVASRFGQLPATAWTFEAVLHTTGTAAEAALFNRNTGLQISGTTLNSTSTSANLVSIDFEDNVEHFSDGDIAEVRIRADGGTASIYRAGLWVRLDPIFFGESCFTIARSHQYNNSNEWRMSPGGTLDLTNFTSPTVYLQAEGRGSASLELYSCSTGPSPEAFFACGGGRGSLSSFASSSVPSFERTAVTPPRDYLSYVTYGRVQYGRVINASLCVAFE